MSADLVHVVVPIAPPGCGKTFFRAAAAQLVELTRTNVARTYQVLMDEGRTSNDSRTLWRETHQAVIEKKQPLASQRRVDAYLQIASTAQPSHQLVALVDQPGGAQFIPEQVITPLAVQVQEIEEHTRRKARVAVILFVNASRAPAENLKGLEGELGDGLKKYLGSTAVDRVVFYYAAADIIYAGDNLVQRLVGVNTQAGEAKAKAFAARMTEKRLSFLDSFRKWEKGAARSSQEAIYAAVFGSAVGAAADGSANYDQGSGALRSPQNWRPLYVLETLLFCAGVEGQRESVK